MNYLSQWLDHWLQKLKPFIPSFLKDGDQLIQVLQQLGPLPPGALLFAADPVSMYTNIHTDHAIAVISAWLDNLEASSSLPADYPISAVKDGMVLVTRNHIFEWGDM